MSNSATTQLASIAIELGCSSRYAPAQINIAMYMLNALDTGDARVIRTVYRDNCCVSTTARMPWRGIIDEFFTSRKKCLRIVTASMADLLNQDYPCGLRQYPEFIHYCITNNLI